MLSELTSIALIDCKLSFLSDILFYRSYITRQVIRDKSTTYRVSNFNQL